MASSKVRQLEGLMEEIRQDGMAEGLLRRALEAALAALMEAEVTEVAGAEYGERSEDRLTRRNGYRRNGARLVPGFSRLPVGISENARQDHAAMVVSSSTEAASAAWRAVTNCRPDEVKW